jgi:hypothetical protein
MAVFALSFRIRRLGVGLVAGFLLVVNTAYAGLQSGEVGVNTSPAQQPLPSSPCDLPTTLRLSYEEMSASRTHAIMRYVSIPEDRINTFRAAYDGFTGALNAAMHREIDVLGAYFLKHHPECSFAARSKPAETIQIEEAKAQALKTYIGAVSSFLPTEKVEELVETDLHLIRTIEVRLGNLAFQTYYGSSR